MAAMSAPLAESPDLERYMIHSRSEIFVLLREIQRRHVLLTVYFNGGSQFIVTSLLFVNPDRDELILDCGNDASVTRALTQSPRCSVVAFLNNVKMQFSARRVALTTFERAPALCMSLPDSLLRFQRREYFRSPTQGKPVVCRIPGHAIGGQPVSARVLDIGCGGVSLLVPPDSPRYAESMLIPGCSIELPGLGTVPVTLEICDSAEISTPSGARQFRYGCAFKQIPGPAAALIQRFVNQLQRERLTQA